jgi:hypothetical protein
MTVCIRILLLCLRILLLRERPQTEPRDALAQVPALRIPLHFARRGGFLPAV